MHYSLAAFIWMLNFVLVWEVAIPWKDLDGEAPAWTGVGMVLGIICLLWFTYFFPSFSGNGGIGFLVGAFAAKVYRHIRDWDNMARKEQELKLREREMRVAKEEKETQRILRDLDKELKKC